MKFKKPTTEDIGNFFTTLAKLGFVILGVGAFVASMHYMALVAGKSEFVRQQLITFLWSIILMWIGLVIKAFVKKKNKKNAGDRFGKN